MAGGSAPASVGDDYREMLARMFAARRFGMRLELERIVRCLDRLEHPERNARLVLQVGGTNGKGSTAAFIEAMLRAGGLRTGLYSSPHLSRFSERFRVDGVELDPAVLVAAERRVAAAADAEGVELTFFERATAMALVGFAAAGAEVLVLEVGMGGRFDATTAVAADVSVVTGVALDHQEHLGGTIAAIAGEKAGIFRAGGRAVIGAAGEPEAVPLLLAAARARGVAEVVVVDEARVAQVDGALGLRGAHQRRNAAAALAAIDLAGAALGTPVSAAARAQGLAGCRLAGRMEIVRDAPTVVVDGAHNPQAAGAVARVLDEAAPDASTWVLVLGVSSDKDAAGVAAPLVARASQVVVTSSRNERARPAAELARVVEAVAAGAGRTPRVHLATGVPVHIANGVADACDLAIALAGERGAVLVAGSLFLVAEAREHLLGEPADPLILADPVPVSAPP